MKYHKEPPVLNLKMQIIRAKDVYNHIARIGTGGRFFQPFSQIAAELRKLRKDKAILVEGPKDPKELGRMVVAWAQFRKSNPDLKYRLRSNSKTSEMVFVYDEREPKKEKPDA